MMVASTFCPVPTLAWKSRWPGYFKSSGDRGTERFPEAAVLTGTDDQPLIIALDDEDRQIENICTRPTAVDWDADGDLDLIVGNFAGSFYVFAGLGNGRFSPIAQSIMAEGSPLRIRGMHSDPFVVDWDGDGDLDLLSGSSDGGVQWAENTAEAGQPPSLTAFQVLIEAGPLAEPGQPLSEHDLKGPSGSTRVWVDDVNEDGRLDILVGDNVMLVAPVAGLSKEELEEKATAWSNALNELSVKLNAATADENETQETIKRLQELYERRAEFVNEERTGFVWLYLQK